MLITAEVFRIALTVASLRRMKRRCRNGVERARGGQGDDLSRYIHGRVVSCDAATTSTFRCEVDGWDLSEVVLYNGGARALLDAPPTLMEAESHAKQANLGIWKN